MRLLAFGAGLLLLSLIPPSAAQTEVLYDFELVAPEGRILVEPGLKAAVTVMFRDLSRDGPATYVDGAPGGGVFLHRVEMTAEPVGNDTRGWIVDPVADFQTFAGDEEEIEVRVQVDPGAAENPYFTVRIKARIATDDGSEFERAVTVLFWTTGIPGFNLSSLGGLDLGPRDIGTAGLRVQNGATFRQTYHFSVLENSCGLDVAAPASLVVPAKGVGVVRFQVQAPEARIWYNSVSCELRFEAVNAESENQVRSAPVSVTIDGWNVKPEWVINTVYLLVGLAILVFFIRRAKERYEEEILQKPAKPWTIPVERVYLEALRRKDTRAWYVVRHHIMEEEYRSALLWFAAYKKATRSERAKERHIIRAERGHARWQAKWKRSIARPAKKAERFEARMRRKLARKAAAATRTERAKVESLRKSMRLAHERAEAKANEKWEKQAAKAAKRGASSPPRPRLDPPDYPPVPAPVELDFASHRLGRRAARFAKRMARKQGNLEVRYERAEARRHARLRKKVRRIGRKLDDPQFLAEHPLLAED